MTLTFFDRAAIEIKNSQFDLNIPGFSYRFFWRQGNPFVEGFNQKKCIFVHVPKAAGSSVSKALFGQSVGHRPIRRHIAYRKELVETYFKFTFVRNPWDRIFSGYNYFNRCVGMRQHRDHRWATEMLGEFAGFESFIMALEDPAFVRNIKKYDHFRNQRDWLCDPSSGEMMMDFVGRFENLERDYNFVCARLGVTKKLPHYRRGKGSDYRTHYSNKMVDIVGRVYEADVSAFSYRFD
jgi:hypothetical protein